ncbi:MAG: hypothetical protein K6G17_06910 [Oscillospiraceae bacterium]|nr:hypothetical protein [Oscillospiraceae bacterium]
MADFRLNKPAGKRISVVLIWLLLWGIIVGSLLMMSSCTDPFSYRSSRISPHDYKGSEWRSNDPFIYLKVQEDGQMKGYFLLDSERIDIICGIEWGHSVTIVRETGEESVRDSDFVLEGTCDCTEQQIIITIEKDYCFGGQFDVIVLDRIKK